MYLFEYCLMYWINGIQVEQILTPRYAMNLFMNGLACLLVF